MRAFLFLFGCLFCIELSGQAFYKSLSPRSDWSTNDPTHIISSTASASSGYSESNSSPSASGGENADFLNCTPSGSNAILTSPVISSIGKSNIRIGFGRRTTGGFTVPVTLEWFDGSSWNNLGDVTSGATWGSTFFDLPSTANNNAALQFRFSFTTTITTGCAAAANFRVDDFWVGANNKLPIQLADFTIAPLSHPTLLWTTLSELNNDYFSIAHSHDGISYQEIAKVNGQGTSDKQNDYTYTDLTPFHGMNYYRLSQVDLDGAINTYPIKSVLVPIKEIAVYPTLFSQKINLELPADIAKNWQWSISDLNGHTWTSRDFANTASKSIDLSLLPVGFYILKVKSDTQQKLFKLIKRE